MATTPDPHPDSFPSGPSEAPDQISPPSDPRRDDSDDVPDNPGLDSDGG